MWLPDLEVWARNIAACLKPGGFFYLAEGHPLLWTLDDEGKTVEENFRIVRSYFLEGPQQWDNARDYAEPEVTLTHFRSNEWQHTLGEVVTVLAAAGLRIEFLHEHDKLVWPAVPSMTRADTRYFRAPEGAPRLPLSYSLKARRE